MTKLLIVGFVIMLFVITIYVTNYNSHKPCGLEDYAELTNHTTERSIFYQTLFSNECCFKEHRRWGEKPNCTQLKINN